MDRGRGCLPECFLQFISSCLLILHQDEFRCEFHKVLEVYLAVLSQAELQETLLQVPDRHLDVHHPVDGVDVVNTDVSLGIFCKLVKSFLEIPQLKYRTIL